MLAGIEVWLTPTLLSELVVLSFEKTCIFLKAEDKQDKQDASIDTIR